VPVKDAFVDLPIPTDQLPSENVALEATGVPTGGHCIGVRILDGGRVSRCDFRYRCHRSGAVAGRL
jgi:hypothetical protein